MPHYHIQLGAFLQSCQSELPVKFCLVGKRRDDFERPSDELLRKSMVIQSGPSQLTQEELVEVHAYRHAVSRGKYAQKALAWVEDKEESYDIIDRFSRHEWDVDGFTLVPVKEMP